LEILTALNAKENPSTVTLYKIIFYDSITQIDI